MADGTSRKDEPTLPDPLVAADVDLRGLPWMRLDTSRLLDSDLFAISTGDEFKAAVALWCKSWTQSPAASLPDDDRVLAHLSGSGARWKKLRPMALRGWQKCSDGRLYHPVVAEQARAAWDERLDFRAKAEAAAERKKREREDRQRMFEELRQVGIVLPYDTKTQTLRDTIDEVTHSSRVTAVDKSRASHGHDTTKTGEGRERERDNLEDSSLRSVAAGAAGTRSDPVPYEKIVAAYHDQLPALARVLVINSKRKGKMRKAWNMLPPNHRTAGAFRAIFAECAFDDRLNGTGPYTGEFENWRPGFDFLIREDQLIKVYEKAQARRARERNAAGTGAA